MQQRVITVVLLTGLCFGLLSLGSAMTSWRLPDREQGYAPAQPIDYSHRLHAGDLGIDCRFCHWAADHSRYAGIPSSSICMKCHRYVTTSWNKLRAEQEKTAKKEAGDAATAAASGPKTAQPEEGSAAADETAKQKKTAKPDPEAEDEEAGDETDGEDAEPEPSTLVPFYQSLGLNADAQPIPGATSKPVEWVRVHNLPDYVYFDHSAHVSVGVTCQECHGPVESMERVFQFASLSMGWCVNCHRDATKNGVKGRPVNAPTNCAACHY